MNTPSKWGMWPATFDALKETYFAHTDLREGIHYPHDGECMLSGLQRMSEICSALHSHRGVAQGDLDAAAAHEVRYHWNRARRPSKPAPYLCSCWAKLPSERPERILDRVVRRQGKRVTAAKIGDALNVPAWSR